MSNSLCALFPEIWFVVAFIVVAINGIYVNRMRRRLGLKTMEEWLSFQLRLILGAHGDDPWIRFVRRFMLFWMLSFLLAPAVCSYLFSSGKTVCV